MLEEKKVMVGLWSIEEGVVSEEMECSWYRCTTLSKMLVMVWPVWFSG